MDVLCKYQICMVIQLHAGPDLINWTDNSLQRLLLMEDKLEHSLISLRFLFLLYVLDYLEIVGKNGLYPTIPTGLSPA